ncbi:RNA degradosome polyphosphate kinase [Alkalicoccus daliensis]|uniref:Polyphosphate kinase n=1 Tax=Alkalicoccus daliensis TaxID=745820 RepID=A0A1H0CPV6_9BACI|nr:RNA degradosome polyphosphate kinase [Alkalicoccus daliensis]SDN59947.1 polyphosphate kinase [Alkalicoccus daliensis]
MTHPSLDHPKLYNNRELSWLAFNQRVLEEAMDERNLHLERCKFLAIFSANLDEFFMVRVAGLKEQVKAGFTEPDNKSGLTPKQQLGRISEKTNTLIQQQYNTYTNQLLPALKNKQIHITKMKDLKSTQRNRLETYFTEEIYPVLTPRAIDSYHPFPQLLSKSLNLAVILKGRRSSSETLSQLGGKFAILQVPGVLDRLVKVHGTERTFVLLEDVIAYFSADLFPGHELVSVTPFRITRNADLTIEEDGASDLLNVIEEEIKKRRWGAEIRLEVEGPDYDKKVLQYLQRRLNIHVRDTFILQGPLDMTFLFSLYSWAEKQVETLVEAPLPARIPPGLQHGKELFATALKKDILLYHPYDSFIPVVDFIAEAAADPSVLAIKQTLYRVSKNSSIIQALKQAAMNGKQVTVLVELKARFDEENNVGWAKELEKEGCHVIYGVTHVKTHSKITLVVRKRQGKIERFVHLGTGNYNDATAKLYTDTAIITTNKKIGIDATNFFNYLSGYSSKPDYYYLSVAPLDIRKDLIQLIDREIAYHKEHGDGHIIIKINSFSDNVLIKKCYEASIAGVKIDLIVRGICCLRPGIPEVSENIRVISIVGRFLEHSRIFYFYHHGQEKTFFSSADLMTRNMEMRIEILFPILEAPLKKQVKEWLFLYLADNVKAREQDASGNYHYVQQEEGAPSINSQLAIKDQIDSAVELPEEIREIQEKKQLRMFDGLLHLLQGFSRNKKSW